MGGNSGGGQSGKVDYPEYMKTKHGAWLDEIDALIPSTNPYTGKVSYDPDTLLSSLAEYVGSTVNFITAYGSWVDAIASKLDAKLIGSTFLQDTVKKVSEAVVAGLDTNVVGGFEAGMRDINAVQSSAFITGRSMLYARVGLETSKFASEMALKTVHTRDAAVSSFPPDLVLKIAALGMEKVRLNIVAKQEEFDKQMELDLEEAKWPFEEFKYAGNLLSSIAGTAISEPIKPNPIRSAIGGMVMGAAAGAYMGGVPGAIAGAVIGGVGGYLMA